MTTVTSRYSACQTGVLLDNRVPRKWDTVWRLRISNGESSLVCTPLLLKSPPNLVPRWARKQRRRNIPRVGVFGPRDVFSQLWLDWSSASFYSWGLGSRPHRLRMPRFPQMLPLI